MARNTGLAAGVAIFVIGVIVLAFTVPQAHPQPPHVLQISASPNEISINNSSQQFINVSIDYSYSYQNPQIVIISPTVNLHNSTTGQNLSYDIISPFSETISTPSYIKTTQSSSTTLQLSINPGAYKVMGNATYLLKIIIQDQDLTYQYGQANVTLIAL